MLRIRPPLVTVFQLNERLDNVGLLPPLLAIRLSNAILPYYLTESRAL